MTDIRLEESNEPPQDDKPKINSGQWEKGQHPNPSTEFKKGNISTRTYNPKRTPNEYYHSEEHHKVALENAQRCHYKLKLNVIAYYSQGNMACSRCGFADIRALSVDHINGGGTKHRSEVGEGRAFWRWLVKNNYPEGYQILCMNCQFIKREENQEYGSGRKNNGD